MLTETVCWRRILEQLASSPQPRYWVSGHDNDEQCATRYARPGKPEGKAVEMEIRMAEEFPPLPSQLFGSPAQDTLPYLSAVKASQQGVASNLQPLTSQCGHLVQHPQQYLIVVKHFEISLISWVITGHPTGTRSFKGAGETGCAAKCCTAGYGTSTVVAAHGVLL